METTTPHLIKPYFEIQTNSCNLLTSLAIWTEEKTHWMMNTREKLLVEEGLTIKMVDKQIHSQIRHSNISVKNHTSIQRPIKLLVIHHFSEIMKGQFCFIAPTDQVIYHLAHQQIHLVSGFCKGASIQQATVQPIWNVHSDLFWKCSQRGILKYQPMAKGPAASIFVLDLILGPQETERAAAWIISSKTKEDAIALNEVVLKNHTSISI